MGRDLITSEHALLSSLDDVSDRASMREFEAGLRDLGDSQISVEDRVRAIFEQAAENPLGLHLYARRLLHEETYESLSQNPFPVTKHQLSPGAIRVRVHRIRTELSSDHQT